MVQSNPLNHFLNQNGFPDARAAEQTNLAALNVRGEKVNDLNPRFEHFLLTFKLVEGRRFAVNRPTLISFERLVFFQVQNFAGHVEYMPLGDLTNGDRDGGAGIQNLLAADQTVRRLQSNGTHHVATQVLLNFHGERGETFTFALAS